ncbi:MAG TPA: DUF2834 domain-containing protein [Nostocaceae cyanobacterium]|nr:DUF2834 domain-containing protein [Nostocaceae cyanobacterium]
MSKKIFFSLIWLGFITYAFFIAPPDQPGNFDLIKNLLAAEWKGINPAIVAAFNIMGIWPFVYSAVLFADGRGQKVPAWPFAVLCIPVGSFGLLPYLIFRQPNPRFIGKKNLFLRIFDARLLGIILTITALILSIYGLVKGDWIDFLHQWQTNRLIHVTVLDFCLLHLLFPAFLGDDMARRNWENPVLFWVFSLIPLFGPLFYLCLRPPLKEEVDAGKITSKAEVLQN